MSFQSNIVLGLNSYIKDKIIKLKNKSYEENWGEINIYKYILNLVGFINNYLNNPTKDRLKIIDWYFIDLIINKGKIIIRGIFYDLGLFIEDKILSEGLLELESRINEIFNNSEEFYEVLDSEEFDNIELEKDREKFYD